MEHWRDKEKSLLSQFNQKRVQKYKNKNSKEENPGMNP